MRFEVHDGFRFDIADFNFHTLLFGQRYFRSETVFKVIYSSGGSEVFRGHDFTYDSAGVPHGGAVTSYQAVLSGVAVLEASGFSLSVQTIVAAASTSSKLDD